MAISRADVALAEARYLIENRTAWPVAPLIGAGANWLRPGSLARMADELATDDAAMTAVREALRPVGVLDAVGILEQHAEFVAARASELEALGQSEAALALQAETAMTDDATWQKLHGQFEGLVMARVKAERPSPPIWVDGLGGAGWSAIDVASRWGATDEALDALGAAGLDARLEEIELAQRQVAARIAWLRRYDFPLAMPGQYDSTPPGAGLLLNASNAHAALAKVHGDATQALGRSAIPTSWDAPEISRRLADRYALRAPALMADMMLREPPIRVIARPEGLS